MTQTSILGSLKKARRITSGEDVIAPRKPTLVNPHFRNSTFDDDPVELEHIEGAESIIEKASSLSVHNIAESEEESEEFHKVSSISSVNDETIENESETTFDYPSS